MKRIHLSILFVITLYNLLNAQEADSLMPDLATEQGEEQKVDSTVIYTWMLRDNFTRSLPQDVDTLLNDFQHYHQAYNISKSNTTLGNLGSPVMPNYFMLRDRSDKAFFLKPYLPYFQTAENMHYYNTRKPFSRMHYTFGNFYSQKEQSFEALHTQNVNPKLNFVLRYHNISSRSQYPNLHVKKNTFRIGGNYTGSQYVVHSVFNFNRLNAGESGGITDSIPHLEGQNPTLLATRINRKEGNISKATKTIRYYDLMVSQRLKLFTLASDVDTTNDKKRGTVAEPIVTHVFKMDRASMFYEDLDGEGSNIYDAYFFNTAKTIDTTINYRMTNTLQLEFKTTFRQKVQTGIYGMVGHQFEQIHAKSLWDSSWVADDTAYVNSFGDTLAGFDNTNDRVKEASIFVSAGIYGNVRNKVKANFQGTVYINGYKAGQTEVKGLITSKFDVWNEEFNFDIEGLIENKVPNLLLENFYSNNFIFEQDLLSENAVRLSGIIGSPSKNFDIRVNNYLLRNHIYFNEQATPENYEQLLNYSSVEATKTFKLWKISSTNKLIYQVTNNASVLPLPHFLVYNSSYIDHTFRFKKTNGELQAILGIDIYYTTKFNGYDYAPALSQFYVQKYTQPNSEIGNRPMADAYLNLKLKRVRFFVKAEHFNSYMISPYRYYAAYRYPYNEMTFKFGVSWVFYD